MDDVVVVIPALNAASTLPRQLRALDEQTDLDFRVIVSDNGSTDGTREVAEAWRPLHRGVRVIDSSARRGVASARNLAIRHAEEDLILICDADDRVHPEWVASMRDALAKADAVTGPLILVKPDQPDLKEVWNRDSVPISMGYRPYMPGCNIGMRRAVFDTVGGFDASLDKGQEDVDFGWRVIASGFGIAHAADARIDYYQRVGLGNFLRQQYRYGRAHVALFERHREAPIPVAEWKTSVRWFAEWAKQLPAAIRRRNLRASLGSAAFQIARCSASLKAGIKTPL